MRPADLELLQELVDMPFIDRLELAAMSGMSRSAVYETVRRLEAAGLVASIPHAADLTPAHPSLPHHRHRAAGSCKSRGLFPR